MVSFENLLKIDDIYLYINPFLDIDSFRNLSISTKLNYNMYEKNKRYIDKQNIINIFQHFNLSIDSLLKPINSLSNEEVNLLNIHLNNLYNKFHKNKYCAISEFINYLVERNTHVKQSYILFKSLLSMCIFKQNISRHQNRVSLQLNDIINDNDNDNNNDQEIFANSKFTRCILTTGDAQYILKYSKLKEFDIIFNWFKFPASLISFTIKDLLYNEKILDNVEKKVMKMIDHFLYNFCAFEFRDNTAMFFECIINDIIFHKKTSLFMYILKKREEYGFPISHQSLLNNCLEFQNLQILKLVIPLIKEDNKILKSKIQVFVMPELILNICTNGSFELLKYIINKMLGRMINSHRYVSSICNGLSSYYINNSNKEFDKNKINWIYEWLSHENKNILHTHLNFMK